MGGSVRTYTHHKQTPSSTHTHKRTHASAHRQLHYLVLHGMLSNHIASAFRFPRADLLFMRTDEQQQPQHGLPNWWRELYSRKRIVHRLYSYTYALYAHSKCGVYQAKPFSSGPTYHQQQQHTNSKDDEEDQWHSIILRSTVSFPFSIYFNSPTCRYKRYVVLYSITTITIASPPYHRALLYRIVCTS